MSAASTKWKRPLPEPSPSGLINASYHPVTARYLIRDISDLAHKEMKAQERAMEYADPLEDLSRPFPVFNEGYPWGQSPEPDMSNAVIEYLTARNLDAIVGERIEALPTVDAREVGSILSGELMSTLEFVLPHIHHHSESISLPAARALFAHLSIGDDNSQPIYRKLHGPWTGLFMSRLLEQMKNHHHLHRGCSVTLRGLLLLVQLGLEFLISQRLIESEVTPDTVDDHELNLFNWATEALSIFAERKAALSTVFISVWPTILFASILVETRMPLIKQAMAHLTVGVANTPPFLRTAKCMPECAIAIVSRQKDINVIFQDPEARQLATDRLWEGTVMATNHFNAPDAPTGEADVSTEGAIVNSIKAIWAMVNPDRESCPLGQLDRASLDRPSVIARYFTTFRARREYKPQALVDGKALELVWELAQRVASRLQQETGSAAKRLLALTDFTSLCTTLLIMAPCRCVEGGQNPKCFCKLLPYVFETTESQIIHMATEATHMMDEATRALQVIDERDDLLLAMLLLKDEFTDIKSSKPALWSPYYSRALEKLNDAIDSVLAFDIDRKLVRPSEENVVMDCYHTFCLYSLLTVDALKAAGGTQNEQTLDAATEERIKRISEHLWLQWLSPASSVWRSKQMTMIILMQVVLIGIQLRCNFGMTPIIRMTLEATVMPVDQIRVPALPLMRLIGRFAASWTVDQLSNMVVAPLLNISKGCLDLQTPGDPQPPHAV